MCDFFTECLQGFVKFKQQVTEDIRETMQMHQRPQALVIACSDSRVDPALLFSCDPGDIFVLRNVGNIVPPCADDGNIHGVSAAIEYAVCVLEVPNIILLGHSHCGAVESLFKTTDGMFIQPWVRIIDDVYQQVEKSFPELPLETRKRYCEVSALHTSYKNLYTFPFIKERCQANKLTIATWFFLLQEAALIALDQNTPLLTQLALMNQYCA